MDPNDNNNNNNKRKKPSVEDGFRARFLRGSGGGQQQDGRGGSSNSSSSNGNNNNNMPRPESAVSSMNPGGAAGRRRKVAPAESNHHAAFGAAAAAADPPGVAAAAAAQVYGNNEEAPLAAVASSRVAAAAAIRRRNNNNNKDPLDSVAAAYARSFPADDSSDNNNPEDRDFEDDSDDDDDDDNDSHHHEGKSSSKKSNSQLDGFLRHLQEFCQDSHVGGGNAGANNNNGQPPSSAINVQKARNVLEACAGNVTLAGQLYWDDYFASQQHNNNNNRYSPPNNNNNNDDEEDAFPPLDAPSAAAAVAAAAAADPAAEEDRRVRRRLESDFERLLPQQRAAEAAVAAAQEVAEELAAIHKNNNPRRRESSRRSRRRAQGRAAAAAAGLLDDAGGGGLLANLGRIRRDSNNSRNNNHNVEEDDDNNVPMEFVDRPAMPANADADGNAVAGGAVVAAIAGAGGARPRRRIGGRRAVPRAAVGAAQHQPLPEDPQALFQAARVVLGAGVNIGAADAVVNNNNNANNNNNPAAVAAVDDDAEASANVSDDEAAGGVAGALRMVRERGHTILRNRAAVAGRRRRRSSGHQPPEDNLDYVRAREMLHAHYTSANATGTGDENQDSNKNNASARRGEDGGGDGKKRKRKTRVGTLGVAAGSGGGGGDSGSDDSDDDGSGSSNADGNNNHCRDDDDEDGYLSENDWILAPHLREQTVSPTSANVQPAQQLRVPMDVLWRELLAVPDAAAATAVKKSLSKDSKAGDGNDDKEANDKVTASQKIKKEQDAEADKDSAKDGSGGEEGGENDGNKETKDAVSPNLPEIPSTWLHASFSPHEKAFGLALKNPKAEDVAENSWQMQQNHAGDASPNNRRNKTLPLPFHCRAVSAILSIVTAMMYSGASIASNQVTCSSSRVPFLELTEEERLREFEGRLIDALSSLIFIAARASMKRKEKALAKLVAKKRRKKRSKKNDELTDDEEDDDDDHSNAQQNSIETKAARRLNLCPVAWWKDSAQGDPIQPADQWHQSADDSSNGPWIQLGISYTNIADIRAYVLSNFRSFCAPGGVALLLETIVCIHGKGAVSRMLRIARERTGKAATSAPDTAAVASSDDTSSKNPFLISCDCEERQRKRLQDSSLTQAAKRKLLNALDTTPPGHDCVSVELISLLATGKIHSTWKGWSTGPLGFGFLSQTVGEIGHALLRPEKPVWVLKGPTTYTVLVMDHTFHGDNLDEACGIPKPVKKDDGGKAVKKALSPSKPKAAPCLKMSQCSSTSRIRDLHEAQLFAQQDRPGYVACMKHINCWFQVRNLSGLRLITDRPKWSPPSPSKVLANYRDAPDAKHSSSLSCQQKTITQQLQERRHSLTNVVSADEKDAAEMEKAAKARQDEAAMERVRFHAEDAKFYPKQYRMWRFDMGTDDGAARDPNSKPRGDHFMSYFALSRDEQAIVEAKFGPQINRILLTRKWISSTC